METALILLICILFGVTLTWPIMSLLYHARLAAPSLRVAVAPKPEVKFKNVVRFVAHDMIENPGDWKYSQPEEPYRRALFKHKSGKYIV